MAGSAFKVGVTVIVAAVLLVFVLGFMGVFKKPDTGVPYYVIFDKVSGLQNGASVLKAGVKIGKVTGLYVIPHDEPEGFRDKVRVSIRINAPEVLTVNSVFSISSNLMGDKWMEITPVDGPVLQSCRLDSKSPWEEPSAKGKSPVSMDDIMAAADETLINLDRAIKSFDSFIGDKQVQEDLKASVAGMKKATADLDSLMASAESSMNRVVGGVNKVIDHADVLISHLDGVITKVGSNVENITADISNITSESGPAIKGIVKNIEESSQSLNDVLKRLQAIVDDEKFGPSILGTLENLENASKDLSGIMKDVREITDDPQVKDDLKATLKQTRETMEGANRLIKRVRRFVGDKDKDSDSNGDVAYSRLMQLDADMFWDTPQGFSHGNANLYLLPRGENMFKIGVDDIGKSNKMNFQYGKNIGSFRPRIGIIRSKPGIGTDAFIGKNIELSVDAYNTSDVQVDLMGKYIINDSMYFMGGVRDAFDTKQGVIGVGKRF